MNDNIALMGIGVILGIILGSYMFTEPPATIECVDGVILPKSSGPAQGSFDARVIACTDRFEACIYPSRNQETD